MIEQINKDYILSFNYNDVLYNGVCIHNDYGTLTFYSFENMNNQEINNITELAMIWWEESNRIIPINVFYPNDILEIYAPYIKKVTTKYIKNLSGKLISIVEYPKQFTIKKKIYTISS